ncbi:hypothetical protein [Leptolyngbya sp. PCC 6406]|uniref:hypothetical protein n=1 Tax=Leptolyngbya sp. PCC 6406 TaxID=1173264 RepID=UPI0002ACE619|nr:hypothetical protein [Leptolyngbya sp. PCC 6406]
MMPRFAIWSLSLSCAALLMFTACSSSPPVDRATQAETGQSTDQASNQASDQATVTTAQSSTDQLKFKHDDGSEAFALKFQDNGAKLVDSSDQEIARLTVNDGGKVKIKDPSDTELGYVVSYDGYWKVKNADQTQDLFVLKAREGDGYRMDDGQGNRLYRIKQRDYGYEIQTAEEVSLYKIKLKDGKLSLRDVNDDTVISIRSAMSPAAMTAFGLDALSLEQQAALAYAIILSGDE